MKLSAPGSTFYLAATLTGLAQLPAWLTAPDQPAARMALFAFFSRLCHQQLDRSILLAGHPIAVCVRCLGIYAGVAIGSLLRVRRRRAGWCLGFALVLNCADVGAEWTGLHGNLPVLRLVIGTILGVAVGAMLSVAEDEVRELVPADRRSGLR